MTRIIAPFAELHVERVAQKDHLKLLTPEYMQKFGAALQAKFPHAKVDVGMAGQSNIDGMVTDSIGVSHVVNIKPEINLTFDVRLHGEIRGYRVYREIGRSTEVYNKGFIVGKTVFPDDDPAILADWVFTETQRRVNQAEHEMKAQGVDKLPFPY